MSAEHPAAHTSPRDGQECHCPVVGGVGTICGAEVKSAAPPWAWIEKATNEQLRERLYEIGPPWGNPKLLASEVEECAWIAFEVLDRLETK